MGLLAVNVRVVSAGLFEHGAGVGREVVQHRIVGTAENVTGEGAEVLLFHDPQRGHQGVQGFLGPNGIVHTRNTHLDYKLQIISPCLCSKCGTRWAY